jgi:hypothetical protein
MEERRMSRLRTRIRMMLRRRGVMGECDARTQGAPIAALSGRPRTKKRAAQHVPTAQGFLLIRVLRRAAAFVALVAAATAIMVMLDVGAWREAIERGDEQYARSARSAGWSAHTALPGDAGRSLLALDDDLLLRRALQLYAVARETPRGFDNGRRQAEARARAEVALSDVTLAGSGPQASQAANLLGVLITDTGQAQSRGSADERAHAAFDAAIRADSSNNAAKYNLELLLRRARLAGTREGPASGSGARGTSRRGAGAGLPGQGY